MQIQVSLKCPIFRYDFWETTQYSNMNFWCFLVTPAPSPPCVWGHWSQRIVWMRLTGRACSPVWLRSFCWLRSSPWTPTRRGTSWRLLSWQQWTRGPGWRISTASWWLDQTLGCLTGPIASSSKLRSVKVLLCWCWGNDHWLTRSLIRRVQGNGTSSTQKVSPLPFLLLPSLRRLPLPQLYPPPLQQLLLV